MSYIILADVSNPSLSTADWRTVFETGSATAKAYNINLRKKIGEAGSLNFTMPVGHPLYNSLTILGTTIQATFGDVGFLGRVVSIQTGFYKDKLVECEGVISWLSDIIARPYLWYDVNNEERAATPTEYLNWIYSQHSSRASTKRRVGNGGFDPTLFDSSLIDGRYVEKQIIQGNEDYRTCLDALNELVALDENAAIIPIGNTVYIANMTTYKADAIVEATISLQGNDANLIHTETDITGDDIYTIVIPLGKDKLKFDGYWSGQPADFVVGTQSEIYGVIEKVVDYKEAEDNAELYSRAQYEISRIENRVNVISVQVAGLLVDLGAKVQVVDTQHGISGNYIVMALDINIDNLGKNSYTLYPCGSSYIGAYKSTLSEITKNGADAYKNYSSFSDGESPIELIQEDDTHIKAVGQNWSTHYEATEDEQEEGKYTLKIYRSENTE